jgi:hypothetical protein
MADLDEKQLALKRKLFPMTKAERIDYLLQKSHFRSDKKVVHSINKTMMELFQLPIPAEDILHRNQWVRRKNNYRYMAERHYEYPIFANHFHSFQMDIIDQSHLWGPDPEPKDLDEEVKQALSKKEQKEQKAVLIAQWRAARASRYIDSENPEKMKQDLPYLEDITDKAKDVPVKTFPPYIYVFQNVNTKYVRAVAMYHKADWSVKDALEILCDKTQVVSLVSDEESALRSQLVTDWIEQNHLSLKLINSGRHTALGVIDRLIRTLRDMNTVERKSHKQSHHSKYRDFTLYRIAKLINIYNNTEHDTTHEIPAEMDQNWKAEEQFIIKKLYQTEQRKRISDFELNNGDFVRYIIPKDGRKRRYSLTPEKYKVFGHEGHAYIIQAHDGTALTVPRWRLKREDDHRKYELAETIPKDLGPRTFVAGEITDIDGRQMTVTKKTPHGDVEISQPLRNLGRTMSGVGEKTPEEIRFWEKQTEKIFSLLVSEFMETKQDGMALISNGYQVLFEKAEVKLHGEEDYGKMTELFMPIRLKNQWMIIGVAFRRGRKDKRLRDAEDTAIPSLYTSGKKPRDGFPDLESRLKKFLKNKAKKINDLDYAHKCAKQTNVESSGIFMIENALALFKDGSLPRRLFPQRIEELRELINGK